MLQVIPLYLILVDTTSMFNSVCYTIYSVLSMVSNERAHIMAFNNKVPICYDKGMLLKICKIL